jgi:hypothetical protein
MELEPSLSAAEEFKNQGNEEFKKKNYPKAIELYSKAIRKSGSPSQKNVRIVFFKKKSKSH